MGADLRQDPLEDYRHTHRSVCPALIGHGQACTCPPSRQLDRVSELQALGSYIRGVNAANGWETPEWDDPNPYAIPGKLVLIHAELSEALEAYREDDREGFAEELADTFIRLLDLAHGTGVDLEAEVLAKVAVNATRGFRHGGKKV